MSQQHTYAHQHDIDASVAETSGHSSRNGRSARGLDILADAAAMHGAHRVPAQSRSTQGYSTNNPAHAGDSQAAAGGYVYPPVAASSTLTTNAQHAYNAAYPPSAGTSYPSSQLTAHYQQQYPAVSTQYPFSYGSSVPAPAVAQQSSLGHTSGAYPAASYATGAGSGSQQQTQWQAQTQSASYVDPADNADWWNQDLTEVNLPNVPICARQGSQELSDEEPEQHRRGHGSHSGETRRHRRRPAGQGRRR